MDPLGGFYERLRRHLATAKFIKLEGKEVTTIHRDLPAYEKFYLSYRSAIQQEYEKQLWLHPKHDLPNQ